MSRVLSPKQCGKCDRDASPRLIRICTYLDPNEIAACSILAKRQSDVAHGCNHERHQCSPGSGNAGASIELNR